MDHVIQYIEQNRPKAFVLENVAALAERKKLKALFKSLIGKLRAMPGYRVNYGIVNTKDFGVPQNRRRIYILGAKSNLMPKVPNQKIKTAPLRKFLLDKTKTSLEYRFPLTSPTASKTFTDNVKWAQKFLKSHGLNANQVDAVVDTSAGKQKRCTVNEARSAVSESDSDSDIDSDIVWFDWPRCLASRGLTPQPAPTTCSRFFVAMRCQLAE